MMRIILIGAGGHAQVVADLLMRMCDAGTAIDPIGYLDDNPSLWHTTRLGLPILGGLDQLPQLPHDGVLVAIGSNTIRQHLFAMLHTQRENLITAIHPRATIAPDVTIGLGTVICANVVINSGSTIGDNVILNTACTVDHHNQIGSHTHIAPGVHLGGEVNIGEGTLVGIGATVMPQKRIGEWSVIGAGAVVTRDVPERMTVVGVPAHPIQQTKGQEQL